MHHLIVNISNKVCHNYSNNPLILKGLYNCITTFVSSTDESKRLILYLLLNCILVYHNHKLHTYTTGTTTPWQLNNLSICILKATRNLLKFDFLILVGIYLLQKSFALAD